MLRDALRLPPTERADIAAELLASLDAPSAPADVADEWAAEITRRIERIRAGDSSLVAWEDLRAEAELRLSAG